MKRTILSIIFLICFLLFKGIISAQESLNMGVLYNWNDSTIPGTTAYNNAYNEIWGYANETGEYAIIGSTMGTHIFDVTDVNNITQVDFVEGAATGTSIVHRDYHDYSGYLYMACQEGASTLQIADLSYLPDSVHVVYDSNELFRGAHNIFIDSATAKMYAMDVYLQGGGGLIGLRIISLEDPVAPVLLHDMSVGSDVHDIYVRNDTGYLNLGWNSALSVYDFSDTQNPDLLGSLDSYEGQGYNHSGWLSDDGLTYVMGDETHGSPVKILDVSELSDIEIIATMTSGVATNSIPHNQIIRGNYIYSSYYYDGVYIWDLEDRENPILVGYYDTSTLPHTNSYEGCWGVYPFLPSGLILASDMQNGLFVLEMDESTGIDDVVLDKLDFSLFPNPSSESLFLTFNNESRDLVEINIYGISGKLVHSQTTNRSTTGLETHRLQKGIYFVKLNRNDSAVRKLIVH